MTLGSPSSSASSVCCIRLSALGDCINAFGVMCAMQQRYSDLKLTWLIDKRFAPLFVDEQGHDLIPLLQVDYKQRGYKSWWDLKKEVKSLASASGNMQLVFDTVLNMQTSLKSSLYSLALKSPVKYGYALSRSREGQRFFVNRLIAEPERPHVLAGFLEFAKAAGYEVDAPCWDFKLDPYLIEHAQCVLGHERRLFTIIPCSAKESKNWTIEGYRALANYAISKGFEVLLLGSPRDYELAMCGSIASACNSSKVINLCGKTKLRELAAYLKLSKLVLAPDSGGMHLASALNVPVIGLFACHNPERVGPWNFMHLNVSVYKELASQELGHEPREWRYRVKDPKAMTKLSIESVQAMFDKALELYQL